MAKKTLRVYFITHHDGRRTGILMRSWSWFFESEPPSAYGNNEDEVFQLLERQLIELDLSDGDLARYLWDEAFETREVAITVHPQTRIKKRPVVGANEIPLRFTFAHSQTQGGAYRIMLPRFHWHFLLEDLDLAPEVLGNAVSTTLLGENPTWIYDYRREGSEYVREWSPRLATARATRSSDEFPRAPVLEAIGEDWVERAVRQKLPPIVGDLPQLEQGMAWARRTPPASILLVGGPGVGKTTWVRALARRFAALRGEKDIAHVPRLWSTSGERILAGMAYLGMWQERCLQIIEELSSTGDYLFVDRLTSILASQPDGGTIADLFLPAIEAGELSLIAECSEAELERCQRRAPRLLRTFQVLRLSEPAPGEVTDLLARYLARRAPQVVPHPAGLRRVVAHLTAFQRGVCFPGKAFRFVDWLAQDSVSSRGRTLYPPEASAAYSRFSGLPLALISDEHPAPAANIAQELRRGVIGQDLACDSCGGVLSRFKAGLNDPERPCGVLLFVGPTGVGKTELAKQLARYMFGSEDRMIRVDMSEYMLPGAAGRLLDVSEGATSLAQRVRQQPLSLVLLDEIEKAHPEVFDLLLGVFGEGRLSDSLGRAVDFRMTLLVMTSNLGAGTSPKSGFFGNNPGDSLQSVRRHFRPEFFNRLDQVLSFRALEPAHLLQIVDLELAKASARTGLRRRALSLEVSSEAKALLAQLGYDPERGARPLRRVIEERVITPAAIRMSQEPNLRDRSIAVLREGETAWRALSEAARAEAITLRD
jgi:ATP-dependent Clp protease ATP-binding subunit ClpC